MDIDGLKKKDINESVRVVRFMIVGTLNAIIVALVVWLMMHIGDQDYRAANIVAYVVSQIHNFIWCKYWIFPLDKNKAKHGVCGQVIYFTAAFLMAYLSQFLFLLLLVEVFHCNEYLAQFLGLFVYGLVNFMSNKWITFR